MAFLKLYRSKLKKNHDFLNGLFKEKGVDWGVVAKLLCGNKQYLKELIDLGIDEIHDARISNLKKVKDINPKVTTCYIKPPPKRSIPNIIKYADVSLNSEFETIKLLSQEAVRQKKLHKVIIMIELGELREGVMGESVVEFYGKIFQLPGISVIGLGTNLNCLTGVMPSTDKLVQLSLYKQLIELKFNRRIPWISGGASITIPLMLTNQLPKSINHLRVGETLYFGNNLVTDENIEGMESSVFELFTEIIEISEKPKVPIGELGENPSGDMADVDEADYGKKHHRAIIDIGLLDIDPKFLKPKDHNVEVIGASSDMLVMELKNDHDYKVGDLLRFELKYMGALSILNSNYIEKRVE